MIEWSINSNGINYEVALEALGQSRQPFMRAIREEKEKEKPSEAFIKYCEDRLDAIDDLQEELNPDDMDTIRRILNPEDKFFRVP